ncbi:MAG: efflux RND transporter periplasmic adaptor subunit [Planctomycetes bacterium]|nr:efflux RND transporter periplasmic adaptor subunit [Planctomycetota bacterium]
MKRRRVTAVAVSTSPQFVQKTNLVRSIESAMEEACDQETTVQHPVPEDAPFVATIAHRSHARAYGHRSILSVPFDRSGEIVGAITLERPEGHPFTETEVLAVEAVAALAGPQLDLAMREDRWIGAKVKESAVTNLRSLFGPRRRALRAILAVLIGGITFTALWQTDYRVSSDVYLEPQQQFLVSTPIQGYVLDAPVRAGDLVKEGDLLYQLDDKELRLDRDRLLGEESQASKRHLQALAGGSSADVRILAAQLEQLRAQIELAEEQLSRVRILSPMDGVVVSGDLSQSIGAPLERGEIVYTVAPLEDFRVVLQVEDADIDECAVGQSATIVLASSPSQELAARVDKITPVSISEEGITYFRVEASLEAGDLAAFLRPGMEGVGKISVGERSLLWTWAHSTVDWFRLFWWKWTP